ncbi:MAG TPA: MDR family oxidoreductase [Roseiflexaceae bacterium]|nr:MDR family oxidoreductase [Roseiflexaceae bacterium]
MAGFTALVLDKTADGSITAAFRDLTDADLPAGDVLVSVHYSSLNYKDGLNVTGTGKIARSFPMVPGIDLAGEVVESQSPRFRPGDQVLLTGYGIGERHWGGFAQRARVAADWLVPLPAGMSLVHSMAMGTAGFTAMLAVMAIEQAGVVPAGREELVSGATGGVGSIAVALLAHRGYRVVAASGRTEQSAYLRALGAADVIDRNVLAAPGRPLESECWGGAIDTVGGDTLAGILRSTSAGGAVAACGNAGGHTLNTTVFPFILRGVQLIGIDSVMCPMERRIAAWARLAGDLRPDVLESITQVIGLSEAPQACADLLAGHVRGRIVIDAGR